MLKKIERIKSRKDYDSTKVYLIDKINENCGFFLFNDYLSFGQISIENNDTSISTSFLDFYPRTFIKAVQNNLSFKQGFFDFLVLKTFEPNLVEDFETLCSVYEKSINKNFKNFINEMMELFKKPSKESKCNAIGFFGELFLIKEIYSKYKIDLSNFWHTSGIYSKYDFSNGNNNVEVKTSITESTTFLIKHSQIFNSCNNYVCVIKLNALDNGGDSLADLIKFMKETLPFNSNIKFQLALRKELKKEIDEDFLKKRFECSGYYMFSNKKLEKIGLIPSCIFEISYKYDFDIGESEDTKSVLDSLIGNS